MRPLVATPGRNVGPPVTVWATTFGRSLTLLDPAEVLRREKQSDGGGDQEWTLVPKYTDIKCAIENVGHRTTRQAPVGGRINSSTTHIIHFDPSIHIKVEDEIVAHENTWIILAVTYGTNQPTTVCEAKVK